MRWRAWRHLPAARAAWRILWPLEDFSAWLRGLELLCDVGAGARPPSGEGEVLPLRAGARLLVVRLGHLGDILHTAPFARAVKRQRPDVRVDLVTGPWSAELARRFDCFDEVLSHAPDFAQFHRDDRRDVRDRRAQLAFCRELRARNYDAAIATSPLHLADQIVLCAAGARLAVGAVGGLARFPVAGEDRRRSFDSRMREADWVCSFLADLGLAVEPAPLFFPLREHEKARAAELLGGLKQRRVVIAPGAGWPGKCWPVGRFAELADAVAAKGGADIVIIGSSGERTLARDLMDRMKTPALNLAGATALGESAAVIAAADLFIGNDSAPLHLAAAVGTPALAFFGPTRASKWAPAGAHNRFLQREGLCDGCLYWHGRAACRHDGRCMQAIAVDEAVTAALALLERPGDFQ